MVGLLVHKIDNTSVIFTEEGNICLAGLQMNSEIGDKIGFNQWLNILSFFDEDFFRTLNTEFMMLNVATSLILLEQHIAIPTLFEECETGTMHNVTFLITK